MHSKTSANLPIGSDHEAVRLDGEYGLQERVCVYDKGTGIVDGLATLTAAAPPFAPHSLDGPFPCWNDDVYGGPCHSKVSVTIQGDICSQCRVRSCL